MRCLRVAGCHLTPRRSIAESRRYGAAQEGLNIQRAASLPLDRVSVCTLLLEHSVLFIRVHLRNLLRISLCLWSSTRHLTPNYESTSVSSNSSDRKRRPLAASAVDFGQSIPSSTATCCRSRLSFASRIRMNPSTLTLRQATMSFLERRGRKRSRALLLRAFEARSFPLAADFQGSPPLPLRYKTVESNSRNEPVVRTAVFGRADRPFAQGVREWIESVGQVRSLRFYVTQIELGPGDRTSVRVRYEIASRQQEALHYRVGQWRQVWMNDRLSRFEPLEETLVTADQAALRRRDPGVFGERRLFSKPIATWCPVLACPPRLGERH